MLEDHHREMLVTAKKEGDPARLMEVVAQIREDLNPHPAGQKTLNAPKEADLTGVQHKYSETVLVFPAAAQTCHAYWYEREHLDTVLLLGFDFPRGNSLTADFSLLSYICSTYCFRWAQV